MVIGFLLWSCTEKKIIKNVLGYGCKNKERKEVACFWFFQHQERGNIKKVAAHLKKNADFNLGEPFINEFAMPFFLFFHYKPVKILKSQQPTLWTMLILNRWAVN